MIGLDTDGDAQADTPLPDVTPDAEPDARSDADAPETTPPDPCEGLCGCPLDRYEPNDTIEQATPLSPGTPDCLTVTEGDRDVFAVEVVANARLRVEVHFDSTSREVGLGLRGPGGEFISGTAGDILRIDRALPEAGTYFVVVQLNVGDPVEYGLTVDVVPP